MLYLKVEKDMETKFIYTIFFNKEGDFRITTGGENIYVSKDPEPYVNRIDITLFFLRVEKNQVSLFIEEEDVEVFVMTDKVEYLKSRTYYNKYSNNEGHNIDFCLAVIDQEGVTHEFLSRFNKGITSQVKIFNQVKSSNGWEDAPF